MPKNPTDEPLSNDTLRQLSTVYANRLDVAVSELSDISVSENMVMSMAALITMPPSSGFHRNSVTLLNKRGLTIWIALDRASDSLELRMSIPLTQASPNTSQVM